MILISINPLINSIISQQKERKKERKKDPWCPLLTILNQIIVVISEAFCLDVAQGHLNEVSNELEKSVICHAPHRTSEFGTRSFLMRVRTQGRSPHAPCICQRTRKVSYVMRPTERASLTQGLFNAGPDAGPQSTRALHLPKDSKSQLCHVPHRTSEFGTIPFLRRVRTEGRSPHASCICQKTRKVRL